MSENNDQFARVLLEEFQRLDPNTQLDLFLLGEQLVSGGVVDMNNNIVVNHPHTLTVSFEECYFENEGEKGIIRNKREGKDEHKVPSNINAECSISTNITTKNNTKKVSVEVQQDNEEQTKYSIF